MRRATREGRLYNNDSSFGKVFPLNYSVLPIIYSMSPSAEKPIQPGAQPLGRSSQRIKRTECGDDGAKGILRR